MIKEWTPCQKEVKSLFKKWHRQQNEQVLEIGGYAGVGKSTILEPMFSEAGIDIETEVLAMAYTGRAAGNLASKGIPASSMHSALMNTIEVPKTDKDGNEITLNGRPLTRLQFEPKRFLDRKYKMLLIDEGSFVDEHMAKIAKSFGLPIYVTGDPFQAPPVTGKQYFLNDPDYTMTTITRQGKDSGIVELATRIREGKEIPRRMHRIKNDTWVLPKEKVTDNLLKFSEMIICNRNKTRNYFNKRIREDIYGIKSKLPVKGDKLICRKNYWNRILDNQPLINGTLGTVIHNITPDCIDTTNRSVEIDFMPEYTDYDYYESLSVDIDYFMADCGKKDSGLSQFNKNIKMELGHAITIYLAQGSQWDTVLYWDDPFGDKDFIRRMRYTAATRAAKTFIYAY